MRGDRHTLEATRFRLVESPRAFDAPRAQPVDHLRVVDDVADRRYPALRCGGLLDDVERAPHAPAISELFGNDDVSLALGGGVVGVGWGIGLSHWHDGFLFRVLSREDRLAPVPSCRRTCCAISCLAGIRVVLRQRLATGGDEIGIKRAVEPARQGIGNGDDAGTPVARVKYNAPVSEGWEPPAQLVIECLNAGDPDLVPCCAGR